MPQLVAALHSFPGLAAVLVAFSMYIKMDEEGTLNIKAEIEAFIGVFIGAITFTGSLVAYGKLDGKIRSAPLLICGWGRHVINAVCIAACIALGICFGIMPLAIVYMI